MILTRVFPVIRARAPTREDFPALGRPSSKIALESTCMARRTFRVLEDTVGASKENMRGFDDDQFSLSFFSTSKGDTPKVVSVLRVSQVPLVVIHLKQSQMWWVKMDWKNFWPEILID